MPRALRAGCPIRRGGRQQVGTPTGLGNCEQKRAVRLQRGIIERGDRRRGRSDGNAEQGLDHIFAVARRVIGRSARAGYNNGWRGLTQPLGKLAAIARATSRRFQHLALNVIASLQGFALLDEPAEPLARAAAGEQEEEDCGDRQSEAQRAPKQTAAAEGRDEAGDHRRPRFQSSSRA